MLLLKIALVLLLIVMIGFAIWLLCGLVLAPLIFKGIFGIDMDDIAESLKMKSVLKWISTNGMISSV